MKGEGFSGSVVKNLPAMQETCVQCLVWEDLLEKGQATHSGILAWEVPWTEEPGGLYNPWGGTELDITDSIFKSRDITLPTKVHLIKAMVFPMVMYGCESRSVKKAEHRRIDAFELWCWRRLFRVSWTARRSNQSILKEINRISLEGMILKMKLQYFGHLMQRVDSLEKTLLLGGVRGRKRRG